tara:strand:- start:58 stop:783 length:726 start_codon:yes stop_codon:yes gene_type:complete
LKLININKLKIYYFIPVLFFGINLFLDTADLDQSMFSFLGHRSIFTHSILLPYVFYYFLIRKVNNPNKYIHVGVISFFVAMGIHLSADLHPRGWQGYANIKFIGADLGGFLSFFWIGINSIISFILASYLLKLLTQNKKYIITYLAISILIGSAYSFEESVNQFKIFLTFIVFLLVSTYHVFEGNTDYLKNYTKKLKTEKNSILTPLGKKKLLKVIKYGAILLIAYYVIYILFVIFNSRVF